MDTKPRTYESFLSAARQSIIDSDTDPSWSAANVARIAFDQQSSIWHAAYTLKLERIADGRLPMDTCSLCGGLNRAGLGDHALCTARAAIGRPTPRLDAIEPCACATCQPGVRYV